MASLRMTNELISYMRNSRWPPFNKKKERMAYLQRNSCCELRVSVRFFSVPLKMLFLRVVGIFASFSVPPRVLFLGAVFICAGFSVPLEVTFLIEGARYLLDSITKNVKESWQARQRCEQISRNYLADNPSILTRSKRRRASILVAVTAWPASLRPTARQPPTDS